MASLRISLAISEYDHVRDFAHGDVSAPGLDVVYVPLTNSEIFHRFSLFREWDVAEMSFAKYVAILSRTPEAIIAIPVFPSRVFRHSAIYVHRDGEVSSPSDLVGKRVGIPEWAQTAGVYVRGFLSSEYNIDLTEIDWIQGGLTQAGRTEKVELSLPDGIRYSQDRSRTLTDMLLERDLDAIIAARAPRSRQTVPSEVVRLFQEAETEERAYYRRTGIFPIMHVIALRRSLVDDNPWIPFSLFKAFTEARDRSIERLLWSGASRFPLAWGHSVAERTRSEMGGELWPYGVQRNEVTLSAFLRFAHAQGVSKGELSIDDLFAGDLESVAKV